MGESTQPTDLHTVLVSLLTTTAVVAVILAVFMTAFTTQQVPGVCEKHGWELEGTGPYQHKHCYDPKTRIMYLPEEINP